MDVRAVDPRTAEREEYNPDYRVYFWERDSDSDIPAERVGYTSYEYELNGAAENGVNGERAVWAGVLLGPSEHLTYVDSQRVAIDVGDAGSPSTNKHRIRLHEIHQSSCSYANAVSVGP
ncbi:MAG: hypothetical protein QOH26_378 [Actinomycetota bacterium]|nr:hypothetical protein [Actinomycetota bacterium]